MVEQTDDDVEGNPKLCPGSINFILCINYIIPNVYVFTLGLDKVQQDFNSQFGMYSKEGLTILRNLTQQTSTNYSATDPQALAHAQDCYFTHVCVGYSDINPLFQIAAEEAGKLIDLSCIYSCF
jgi:hypothetical protein